MPAEKDVTVKLLTRSSGQVNGSPGDVVTVSAKDGKALIDGGFAVAIDGKGE